MGIGTARHIVVIGSGIAGMAAAWLLSHRHRVTMLEQDCRIGGHAHTVDVPRSDGVTPVDTGFIVYNEVNYPNLVSLFAHLGVGTIESDMSFSVSLDDGNLEYSGTGLAGIFSQTRNLVRPRHWRMLRDILRFYREGPSLLAQSGRIHLSLGDYLDQCGYSTAFIEDHLLPMAAAIWSAPMATMRSHPAAAFVRFCVNHALMQVRGRPHWRTVAGGSRNYIHRLTESYADAILTGARVRAVHRNDRGARVVLERGGEVRCDGVVIATHADQALAMLVDASEEERQLLGAFRYSRNQAVLHGDPTLMPRRRRVWSSWNYIGQRGGDRSTLCVSYWMNRLQSIDHSRLLFVTLNPHRPPRDGMVFGRYVYHHPVYDVAALEAQGHLRRLQGKRQTWFCGSYFGAGFHEDALVSGLEAAEAAGGMLRPWAGRDRLRQLAAQ